ncbi:MAG: glycosyltransferase [bacterium]|nr:glycosyltransferase [bacterium]
MKTQKITIFHQEFYYSGGAELTLFETIDYLTSLGYTVECFAPLISPSTCYPDIISKYRLKHFFPYFKFIPRELTIILAALLAPLLVLRFRNTDLFYGANQAGPYFAYIASLIHKKPFIVYSPYPLGILYPRKIDQEFAKKSEKSELSSFGNFLINIIKPILKSFDKRIIKSANALITESVHAKQLYIKIYNREVISCTPGTNIITQNEFNEIDKLNGSVTVNNLIINKPYILLTNRHMPKKKFEYALEVAKNLSNTTFNNTTFVITGKYNEYTVTLKNLVNKYNLKNIIFTDYVTDSDINLLYKNSAIYLYTAPEEDYGKGIAQAIGCGTPAIAWNNAGPISIIKDNQTGFLIPLEDTNKMTQKIIYLLQNPHIIKSMGQNAIVDARQYLSKDIHNKVILDTIKKILPNDIY